MLTSHHGRLLTLPTIPHRVGAITPAPPAGEIALDPLVRQNIGPLVAIDPAGGFANIAQPWRGMFNRYTAAKYEPASWTKFINNSPLFEVIRDIQYAGLRLEYALCTGGLIGADATDESDTTVQHWAKFRRMARVGMDNYYVETAPHWGAAEPWKTVFPTFHALAVMDPGWNRAALVLSNLHQVTAATDTVDEFGYLNMTNANAGPRLCYQAMNAMRNAVIRDFPYQSYFGAGASSDFSSWLEAFRWLRDRILNSPAVSPSGYPEWMIRPPGGSAQCYMDMLLAREFLLGDEFVESHQPSRDFAYGVSERYVDLYYDILKPLGRTHLPEGDFNGIGSMNYQDYHINLTGTYIDAWFMCWQDTGLAKFRDAALEILDNLRISGASPFGTNVGKELGEMYFGMFRAYAMEQGAQWRVA